MTTRKAAPITGVPLIGAPAQAGDKRKMVRADLAVMRDASIGKGA